MVSSSGAQHGGLSISLTASGVRFNIQSGRIVALPPTDGIGNRWCNLDHDGPKLGKIQSATKVDITVAFFILGTQKRLLATFETWKIEIGLFSTRFPAHARGLSNKT